MPTGIYKGNKGKKLSQETKDKISKNSAKYWLGKKMPEETRNKISLAKKGKLSFKKGKHYLVHSQENHGKWKGNKVGYRALHTWINKKLGKALHCSVSLEHKSTRYHWANISGEYKRELNDWRQLCPSCNLKEHHKVKNIFIVKGKHFSVRKGGESLFR